jgi:hypothetical protein
MVLNFAPFGTDNDFNRPSGTKIRFNARLISPIPANPQDLSSEDTEH